MNPGRFRQRNRGGLHHWAATGCSEPFESLLEWRWLRTLEFDVIVHAVRTQRVFIQGGLDHYVDFFIELEDGSRLLPDVRAAALFDDETAERFDRTRKLACAVGLEYLVFDDTDPDLLALSRDYQSCRHGDVPGKDVEAEISSLDDDPVGLDEVCRRTELSRPEVVTIVRYLVHAGTGNVRPSSGWSGSSPANTMNLSALRPTEQLGDLLHDHAVLHLKRGDHRAGRDVEDLHHQRAQPERQQQRHEKQHG